MELPKAFDAQGESVKFLAKAKQRAAKGFSFTKSSSLQNTADLAYWLYLFGREDEALEISAFLGAYEFSGRSDLWSGIEETLALQSRILRHRKKKAQAEKCLDRIRKAGFNAMRLKGGLLVGKDGTAGFLDQIQYRLDEGDDTGARDWRLVAVKELFLLIELGGSRNWSVQKAEKELQDQVDALKVSLRIPKSKA